MQQATPTKPFLGQCPGICLWMFVYTSFYLKDMIHDTYSTYLSSFIFFCYNDGPLKLLFLFRFGEFGLTLHFRCISIRIYIKVVVLFLCFQFLWLLLNPWISLKCCCEWHVAKDCVFAHDRSGFLVFYWFYCHRLRRWFESLPGIWIPCQVGVHYLLSTSILCVFSGFKRRICWFEQVETSSCISIDGCLMI